MTPTRKPRPHVVASAIVAFALVIAACSGDGGDDGGNAPASGPTDPSDVEETTIDPAVETGPDADESTNPPEPPATAPESTPDPTRISTEPLFGEFDQSIELLTSSRGGGIRPTLEWTEVPGVDHYGVYLYAPSGEIYWAWRGRTTSIVVGGEPRLSDAAPGPSVSEGMTWAVVAYDADLLPLAVSPAAPIFP